MKLCVLLATLSVVCVVSVRTTNGSCTKRARTRLPTTTIKATTTTIPTTISSTSATTTTTTTSTTTTITIPITTVTSTTTTAAMSKSCNMSSTSAFTECATTPCATGYICRFYTYQSNSYNSNYQCICPNSIYNLANLGSSCIFNSDCGYSGLICHFFVCMFMNGQPCDTRLDYCSVACNNSECLKCEKLKKFATTRNQLIREFLSETLSTFLLLAFSFGSNAQYILSDANSFNNFLSTNLSTSTAVTVAILVGGKVSGAQMNPAISFSMLLHKRIGLLQFVLYVLGQCIGAFLASVLVYVVYLDTINWYDGGVRKVVGDKATAGIWGTYPLPHLTIFGAFMDQVVGTCFLVIIVLAIDDKQHGDMSHGLKALMVGNAILVIGLSYGMNSGYAINPARDFIPRLFTAIAGWGGEVFTAGNYFFWIPLIAPFIGATIGSFIFYFAISIHGEEANIIIH